MLRPHFVCTSVLFSLLFIITIPAYSQESILNKTVCVTKNVLLQGHFTVKIRPKKADCEKFEEEMRYERKKNGTILLFPLSPPSEETIKQEPNL